MLPPTSIEIGFADGAIGELHESINGAGQPLFDWAGLGAQAWRPEVRTLAAQAYAVKSINEYRSASFMAQVVQTLTAAVCPLDMCSVVSGFVGHELRHCELFARVVAAIGQEATTTTDGHDGVFPISDGLPPLERANELMAHMFVCETISYHWLQQARRRTTTPLLSEVYAAILRDEVLHARFAELYFDWIADALDAPARAAIARTARTSIAAYRETWHRPSSSDDAWSDHERAEAGLLSRRDRATISDVTISQMIVPKFRSLGVCVA